MAWVGESSWADLGLGKDQLNEAMGPVCREQ